MPDVQVYTANNVASAIGKGGRIDRSYDAACLETQYFPNAIEIEPFEKPSLKTDATYIYQTIYHFTYKYFYQEEFICRNCSKTSP